MKKTRFLIFLVFLFLPSIASELKGSVQQKEFVDYMELVNLTAEQREQVLKIRNEENFVLKPLSLDIESKERGLELLNSLQCKTFDFECKDKLKKDIEQREFEKNEVLRKILQKKNYYKIRYRNILTREQDLQIQQYVKDNELKDKVTLERAKRAKKQARIEKLKVWNRFQK